MIFDLIRNGFSLDVVVNLCARVFVLFCVLPIHEFAHALVSTKLGDQTARLSGRLTLNPLAHIDPLGAVLIIVAGFGYAKPVPVNPRNFKNQKSSMALTAAAGPISNLIMSFLFTLCYCLVYKFTNVADGSFADALAMFLWYAAQINVSLAVFNLLPIPPLDGSRIISLLIPDRYLYKFAQYERYLVYAVMILVLIGVFDRPMSFVSTSLIRAFLRAARAIVGV